MRGILCFVRTYSCAMYFVASSAISAILEMFLATTLVLWEAAMNQAGVPGICRTPVKK